MRQSLLEEASFVSSSHRSQDGLYSQLRLLPISPVHCLSSLPQWSNAICMMHSDMQHLRSCRHSNTSASKRQGKELCCACSRNEYSPLKTLLR